MSVQHRSPAPHVVPSHRNGIAARGLLTNGSASGTELSPTSRRVQSSGFGEDVFTDRVMRERLPKDVFRAYKHAINTGGRLDPAVAHSNPCVNAGAIAVTSLIKGADPTARLNRVLDLFGKYFGRRVQVDMSVFMSERTTGHRNRAIAYLMLNFGMISDNVDQILDLYFQQCSILGNCRDLAVMAATLANNGVNPITHERAVDPAYLTDILTVMYTCGMYDFAGQWGYSVGLPAKSGVAGSIVAVVPNQLGIAVYSPPLDSHGNSVRGIKVCQDLSQEFGMHMFDSVLTNTPAPDPQRTDSHVQHLKPTPATATTTPATQAPGTTAPATTHNGHARITPYANGQRVGTTLA